MKRVGDRLEEEWVRLLLRLYPSRFRSQFADEILDQARRRRSRSSSRWQAGTRILLTVGNLLREAPRTWLDELDRDRVATNRRQEKTMGAVCYEVLHGLRSLWRRQPGVSFVCVLTLALGIGASTAIFSVVDGVLLAPLPYGDPERIVRVYQGRRESPAEGFFAGPNFTDLRGRLTTFDQLAGYYDYRPEGIDLLSGDRADRLEILRVSAGYFEALGMAPLHGRTFRADEEIPNGSGQRDPDRFAMVTAPSQPVAVLSHGLWAGRFGARLSVVGESIELDGSFYTVVGVMPARFGGLVGGRADLWLPLDTAAGGVNVRYNNYLSVVGRLREGVTLESARAELATAAATLEREYPEENEKLTLTLAPLREEIVGPSRRMLGLLLAAVGVLLLVACLNVAAVLVFRGLRRQTELAVRSTLGASRARLFLQAAIESAWLTAIGGGVGVVLAWGAIEGLLYLRPEALPRYDAIDVDSSVLLFAFGTTLLAVVAAATWPALQASRADGRASFHGRAALGAASRRVRRLQAAVVTAQVGLTTLLLASGGVLARSLVALQGVDMGFSTQDVLTFQLRLPDYRYGEAERRIAFYDAFFAQLDADPSIRASGATSKLPGDGHRNHWGFRILGRERNESDPTFGAEIRCVAGAAIEGLGIPVLRGRGIVRSDRVESERVVLINAALAERYFESEDPIGARLLVGGPEPRTVVGVVGDTRHDPREPTVPKIYVPQTQFAGDRNWDLTFVVARAAARQPPWSVLRSQIEATLRDLDSHLTLYDVRTLAAVVGESAARQRFAAILMSVFSGVALVLASVGLFGVMSYATQRRRSELGLRMALGARRNEVLWTVIVQGLRMTVAGLALGLIGVWASRPWLEALVFGVRPDDPLVLFAVAVLLVAVALASALGPAWRAIHLDPARVLRSQ